MVKVQRCVLEEFCKVAEGSVIIPSAPKGKWLNNGCIMGDGFSVAWTIHDAKEWCVPQRRKRISVVADFGGQSAAEILFESESLSGDIEQSREAWQGSSRDIGNSVERSAVKKVYPDTTGTICSGLSHQLGNTQNNCLVVEENSCAYDGSQTSPTLTCSNANGSQRMPDKDNFNCVLQGKKNDSD